MRGRAGQLRAGEDGRELRARAQPAVEPCAERRAPGDADGRGDPVGVRPRGDPVRRGSTGVLHCVGNLRREGELGPETVRPQGSLERRHGRRESGKIGQHADSRTESEAADFGEQVDARARLGLARADRDGGVAVLVGERRMISRDVSTGGGSRRRRHAAALGRYFQRRIRDRVAVPIEDPQANGKPG